MTWKVGGSVLDHHTNGYADVIMTTLDVTGTEGLELYC